MLCAEGEAMSNVTPIPEGYETITPYLSVKDGAAAIDFYRKAFEATETQRMPGPEGKGIGHADLVLFGRMHLMLADEYPEMGHVSPQTLGGSPVLLHIYVDDVDAVIDRAVAAGAKVIRPIADQFYGDRAGGIEDPWGHHWFIATREEILSQEEVEKRAAELTR
jgi:PhnB protein